MKKFLLVVLSAITVNTFADVKLPAIISDNMVLQQNTDVRIWGWADAGEKITITAGWNNQKVSLTADSSGNWQSTVKTPKANGKSYKLTIKAGNAIEVNNVIIGELWLCSGQSNMDMPMKGWDKQPIEGGEQDIASSANKKIRLFIVDKALFDKPSNDVGGKWVECSPDTVKDFSAIGYYFARYINSETGYPVGVIHSAWGGTLAQAWMRIDCMVNDDSLKTLLDWYDEKLKLWQDACQKAEQQGNSIPNRHGGIRPQDKPASLYNGMIAPLTNMTIKGAIWYQGESNVGNSYLYRNLFPALIENWRCDFNNFSMPFYFVQLASYTNHKPGTEVKPYRGIPRDDSWSELREAQFMTNLLKNTGMAVTIDIGQTNCIHPANKREVGRRLGLWALAKDYGRDIECSGPLYAGYWIESDKIRIAFSHSDSGLVFKDGTAKGFAIAGADRKFIWADAVIDGQTVLVWSDKIRNPVAVRYAWDIDPKICLYNNAGIPASPFRTDDWDGITYKSRHSTRN